MDQSYFHPSRASFILLVAVLLAGCINPAPAPTALFVSEEPGTDSTPSVTLTTAPTATSTPLLPTFTPTLTATSLPQPIGFHSAEQLQIIRDVENFDDPIALFSRALSPDGRLAAAAGCLLEGDDTACHGTTFFRLYDVESTEALFDPEYLSPAIEVLSFSPDGRVLAAAGCDISLWIYGEMDTICDLPRAWMIDTATGGLIAELEGYTSHVTDFAFSPDSSTLFTSVVYNRRRGDGDHVIRVYDAHSGEKLATIETGMISCTEMLLDMSPDGRYLVGNVTSPCGYQSFVAWWNVSDSSTPVKLGNVDSYGTSQISLDSTQILVHNLMDRTFKVYDLAAGSPVKSIPAIPGGRSLRRFIYLDNRETVLLDFYGEYDILDIASGEVIRSILPPEDGYYSGYMLTPDRKTLFIIGTVDDPFIEAWDLATWQSVQVSLDPDYSWVLQNLFGSSRMTFLPGATAFIGVSIDYGSVHAQTWGLADSTQAEAAQTLRDYFDLLVNGEYEAAADSYISESSVRAEVDSHASFYTQYPVAVIAPLVPDLDFSNLAEVFASLCQEAEFPCMPVQEILHQAKVADGLYRFTVTFALPDGSLADWSPCNSLPADYYCPHRGGIFEYYVYQTPEGGFKIVESLPPSIALLLKY
jgi:WD40 repeat protein